MMARLTRIGAIGIALLAGLAAGGAQALSCMPPSVEVSYARAAASEHEYIVFHGVIRFDESKLPEAPRGNPNDTPKETRIPARIEGMAMSRSGFDHAISRKITLSVPCRGPWCGGLKSGARYLAFLRREGAGYELVAEPCGGWAFSGTTDAHAQAAHACYKSGSCTSQTPKRR